MVEEYYQYKKRPVVPSRKEQAKRRMRSVELVMTETDVLKKYNMAMKVVDLWDDWDQRASAWKRDASLCKPPWSTVCEWRERRRGVLGRQAAGRGQIHVDWRGCGA